MARKSRFLDQLATKGAFQLQGRTIKVVLANLDDQDAYGTWEPSLDRITIDRSATPDMQVHAFLHEFTHAALEACGRHDLSKKEAFVDTFSGLVHQMLITKR